MDDIELLTERNGYPEETHFAFSYTPVRDEWGRVAGFFCPCVEITEQVMGERRPTPVSATVRCTYVRGCSPARSLVRRSPASRR